MGWKTVTNSRDPRFMVKGTELATMIAGELSRFQICEIRAYDAERAPTVIYKVRDADFITDSEVRAGKRPPVVKVFAVEADAFAFCQPA